MTIVPMHTTPSSAAVDLASRQCKVLDRSSRDFTDRIKFQGLLRDISNAKIAKVDLKTSQFASQSDFTELLMTIKSNQDVVELDLSNRLCSDYITNDGTLCRLLQGNNTLQTLDLSGLALNHGAVEDLVQGLDGNKTLTKLHLRSCLLEEYSAALVLSRCASSSIRVLDLGANNTFSPMFLNTNVAACLRQAKNLRSLSLNNSSSMFDVREATFLRPFFQALQDNTTLTSLSLRFCRLSDSVGEALLQALTVNTTLLELDLEFSGFCLRGKGNEILLRFLPQLKALQKLNIIAVFKTDLVPRLISAVKKNSSLRVFNPCFGTFGMKFSNTSKIDSDEKSKQHSTIIQGLLQRNRLLAQVDPMLQPGARVPPSLLATVCSHLMQTEAGSTATLEVLQHFGPTWIPSSECISFFNEMCVKK